MHELIYLEKYFLLDEKCSAGTKTMYKLGIASPVINVNELSDHFISWSLFACMENDTSLFLPIRKVTYFELEAVSTVRNAVSRWVYLLCGIQVSKLSIHSHFIKQKHRIETEIPQRRSQPVIYHTEEMCSIQFS